MTFPAVLVRRTILSILYYQFLCNFVVRRFRRHIRKLYPKGKSAVQRKFDGLVTNNIFVIIATLIITFYI